MFFGDSVSLVDYHHVHNHDGIQLLEVKHASQSERLKFPTRKSSKRELDNNAQSTSPLNDFVSLCKSDVTITSIVNCVVFTLPDLNVSFLKVLWRSHLGCEAEMAIFCQ